MCLAGGGGEATPGGGVNSCVCCFEGVVECEVAQGVSHMLHGGE
jgi:hypothetical protein